ncbi:MAG TPA: hypothetical protein V6D05_01105 [Stenomitos sp.]
METLFLACFLFGALFSGLSAFGFLHSATHGDHIDDASASHSLLRYFNVTSLVAFSAWFGAAGYLLRHFAHWPSLLTLPVAVVAGWAAAWIVRTFIDKVRASERVLHPGDFLLEGTIAKVTVSIPADGVGEVVFPMAGARRSEGARSANGEAIARECEVVITGYEQGVAVVQPLDEIQ